MHHSLSPLLLHLPGLSLGLWKLGAVVAFINYNLRQNALVHSVRVSKAKALVFSASLSDPLAKVIQQLEPHLSQSLFSVRGAGEVEGGKNLDSELEKMSHLPLPPPEGKSFTSEQITVHTYVCRMSSGVLNMRDIHVPTSLDIACFIYTSGTTGLPKPCRVTHFKQVYMPASCATYSK